MTVISVARESLANWISELKTVEVFTDKNCLMREEALWGKPAGAKSTHLGSEEGGNSQLRFPKYRKILESGNFLPVILLACLYHLSLSLKTTDHITYSGTVCTWWDSATMCSQREDLLSGPELLVSAACFTSADEQSKQHILPFMTLTRIIIDHSEAYLTCLKRKHFSFPLWMKDQLWCF